MVDCTIIIFGITGDLTKRKLIPAIYHLLKRKKVDKLALVGVARRQIKMNKLLNAAKPFIKNLDAKVFKKLQNAAYYRPFNFNDPQGYSNLKEELEKIERKHGLKGNRLFYFATLPHHFGFISHNLAKKGVTKSKGWARLVYEKPFGHDLKSAKKMNKSILRAFKEKQVYRIDHYLGKEIVGNIALVRFTNRIFEPLWNNKHIESVQIILDEKLGIEDRAKYYDEAGALRDVVQNHMMQMLALTAMEEPKKLTAKRMRNEKANVLKKIKVEDILLGQYDGYKKVPKIEKNSKTETFAAIKLRINTKRWKGVPFYLKTGKKLDKKDTSIHIKFKKVNCLLAYCPRETNYLEMRIQPELGFALQLNSKVPEKNIVVPVKMDFCHECIFGKETAEAYEVLLEDVIEGDQSVFVRNDEIEYAWKVIDKIRAKKLKVYPYKKGSVGPEELKKFAKKHNMRWRI